MYEQVSHALLNDILDRLSPDLSDHELRHFHVRLGANFYAIHSLFAFLYGHLEDFPDKMAKLVDVLARAYLDRPEALRTLDAERERRHDWFLDPQWVGMALYSDGFAGDIEGLSDRLPYLQDLGVNLLHVMPILKCPKGASDGGYAVSDYRQIDERFGTLEQVRDLARRLRERDMLLTLDVVLNHTSEEHAWARAAREGDEHYRAYYHVYADRDVPDRFEETMPEVFPETSPGNFTWNDDLEAWVMTVFNHYQWDLNYRNPDVFIEMVDIVLFWANQGADVIRMDAVAFLWKKIGTTCQNQREAHLILQLMKDCCQVVAPGLLFIAEAIVAPVEVAKYFGEDAVVAKECEIAYNATFMALLWDAVATRNAKLLTQGVGNLPDKLDRATWLNYIRCHDDIGLGFDDRDVVAAGYDPARHRRFLIDYYTGAYETSPARGKPFAMDEKTGDARISGSLASLAGLEAALDGGDAGEIDEAVDLIILLHALIMSFGGIPLLYYGDEIGTLNDASYLEDPAKANDSRWMHRPRIDWEKAELRSKRGTLEHRLFSALRKLISVRKATPAFADYNNRELIRVENPHLFVFRRTNPQRSDDSVLVVGNFDSDWQTLDLADLGNRGRFELGGLTDLYTGESVDRGEDGRLRVPGRGFYWLVSRPGRGGPGV